MESQTHNWLKVAERITSEYLDTDVRLGEPERLGRKSNVFRCPLIDVPIEAPAAVVVKTALEDRIYDPDSLEGSAPRLLNDWAGYEFLTAHLGDTSPAPIFFGGDRDAGIIVIQDLSQGIQLDQLLLGDDARSAEDGLVAFAATLGEMHAATVGKHAAFNTLRTRLGPTNLDNEQRVAAPGICDR